jgi:hypothetical protein
VYLGGKSQFFLKLQQQMVMSGQLHDLTYGWHHAPKAE